nr:hypothetical protein [uncultured Allomuricauda sp.]
MFKSTFVSALFLLLCFGIEGQAQNQYGVPKTAESPIYIEGFNYPKFDDLSHYARFTVGYEVMDGTDIQVIGQHYRRYGADRISLGTQLKQRISDNFYFLGGYQKEWDLFNKGRGYPNPVPRQEIFFGIEHQVRQNMLMEVKMVHPINESDFYSIGLDGVGTRVELGTRIKF